MRFVHAAALGAALAGLSILMPPTGAGPSAQTVHATGGTYAMGDSGLLAFPDGSVRSIRAVFVVPDGTIVGSDGMATADMRRAWATFSMMDEHTAGNGLTQRGCETFSNPTSWRGPVSRPFQGPYGPERIVEGAEFTTSCPGDRLYARYTLRWDAEYDAYGPSWVMNHQSSLRNESWAWRTYMSGAGTLEADITSSQDARMRVCATRHNGDTDCWGGGLGRIYPTMRALHTTAYSTD